MEEKLKIYYTHLVNENKLYNLTAITKEDEVYIKHFEDSLSLENIFDLTQPLKMCDVGSGAGFPGIVLALKYPNISLTIIEPTLKRVNFMKSVANLLELNNVTFINDRSEVISKDYEECFDIVVARAVSSLNVLLELTIKLVKTGGYFVAYKGEKGTSEISEANKAIKLLNCKVEDIYNYQLKNNYGSRMLIKIKKLKKTDPMYPRRYQEIKKKPL